MTSRKVRSPFTGSSDFACVSPMVVPRPPFSLITTALPSAATPASWYRARSPSSVTSCTTSISADDTFPVSPPRRRSYARRKSSVTSAGCPAAASLRANGANGSLLGIGSRAIAWMHASQAGTRSSAERHHDVLAIARPRLQALVPRLDARESRALDRQVIPPVDEAAERDVAESQVASGQVRLPRQDRVGDAQHLDRLDAGRLERGVVALLGRRADVAPEERPQRRLHAVRGPVHPLVRDRALRGRLRRPVLRIQVAHDRVRLPQHEIAVLDRRDQAVGVQTAVLGRVDHPELPAGVDALAGHVELGDRPHHLLHVDRVDPSPDLHHVSSSAGPPAPQAQATSRAVIPVSNGPGAAAAPRAAKTARPSAISTATPASTCIRPCSQLPPARLATPGTASHVRCQPAKPPGGSDRARPSPRSSHTMPRHQGRAPVGAARKNVVAVAGSSTRISHCTRSASSHAARAAASPSMAPSGTSSAPSASLTSPSSSAPGVASAPGNVLPTRVPARTPSPPRTRAPAATSAARSLADQTSNSMSSPLPVIPARTGGSPAVNRRWPNGGRSRCSASRSGRRSGGVSIAGGL